MLDRMNLNWGICNPWDTVSYPCYCLLEDSIAIQVLEDYLWDELDRYQGTGEPEHDLFRAHMIHTACEELMQLAFNA